MNISVMCTEPSSYHVVAVVRKGSRVTWSNLKGKKSCHTALNLTAGWKIPRFSPMRQNAYVSITVKKNFFF